MILPLFFAAVIGAVLVSLGAGGSIITLPVLVYTAGLDMHHAVGTSLLVVGTVAAAGAFLRRRSVALRTGLLFGGAGVVGAMPGVWLNHQVPAALVLFGFGATMLVVAALMFRAPSTSAGEHSVSIAGALATGFAVGTATGFFGVGGGFLIVPAMSLLLNLRMSDAVATSLLVIALNSLGALIGHGSYGAVDWQLGLAFAAVALLGAGLAQPVAQRLHGAVLEKAFATLVALVGSAMTIDAARQLLA